MKTYYAVCNSNGPISVAIEARDVEHAMEQFAAANNGEWIDDARDDAENDLDIDDGYAMDEDAFADAMRDVGYVPVRDIDVVANHQAGTAAHLDGGWMLWGRNHECVHCGKEYSGDNTVAWPVGYGRYEDKPCHPECEDAVKRENNGDDDCICDHTDSFCPVHNGYGCEEDDIVTGDGIYEVHPGASDDLDSYAVVNSQTGAVRADGMTLEDAVEYADELNAIANGSPSIPPGSRVCGGEGDDYDEGTLDHYDDDGMAIVRWDSCVVTPTPVAGLRRL